MLNIMMWSCIVHIFGADSNFIFSYSLFQRTFSLTHIYMTPKDSEHNNHICRPPRGGFGKQVVQGEGNWVILCITLSLSELDLLKRSFWTNIFHIWVWFKNVLKVINTDCDANTTLVACDVQSLPTCILYSLMLIRRMKQ